MAKTDIENVRKARKVPVLATGADLDTGFGDPIFRHDGDEGPADGKIRGLPRLFAALVRRDSMTVAEIGHAGKTKA